MYLDCSIHYSMQISAGLTLNIFLWQPRKESGHTEYRWASISTDSISAVTIIHIVQLFNSLTFIYSYFGSLKNFLLRGKGRGEPYTVPNIGSVLSSFRYPHRPKNLFPADTRACLFYEPCLRWDSVTLRIRIITCFTFQLKCTGCMRVAKHIILFTT